MADLVDTLDDLALLISRAEKSVYGRTFDELVANDEAYDALTYRLAMIGETSKKLPDDLKRAASLFAVARNGDISKLRKQRLFRHRCKLGLAGSDEPGADQSHGARRIGALSG